MNPRPRADLRPRNFSILLRLRAWWHLRFSKAEMPSGVQEYILITRAVPALEKCKDGTEIDGLCGLMLDAAYHLEGIAPQSRDYLIETAFRYTGLPRPLPKPKTSPRPQMSSIEASHRDLRAAVILAGRHIRKLNFGKRNDPVLVKLREVLRESRIVATAGK